MDESDGCHWHIVARGQSGESGDILELCQDVWWTDIINLATWHLKALTGQSGESGDIWELSSTLIQKTQQPPMQLLPHWCH